MHRSSFAIGFILVLGLGLVFGQATPTQWDGEINLEYQNTVLKLNTVGEVESDTTVMGLLSGEIPDTNASIATEFRFGSAIDEKSISIVDLLDPKKTELTLVPKLANDSSCAGTFEYNATANKAIYCFRAVKGGGLRIGIKFKYRPIDSSQWQACLEQGRVVRVVNLGFPPASLPYRASYELTSDPALNLTINRSCVAGWTLIPIEGGFRCENNHLIANPISF